MTEPGGEFSPPFPLVSTPPYPTQHAGTAFVVGSAWCAFQDLENARALFRDAYVIGVNRTGEFVDCDTMVAVDRLRAKEWKSRSRLPVALHGGRFGARGGPEAYPWYDFWWPELQSHGTSVWLGCKIAAGIGFRHIIVCGAPLEPGPYLDGEDDWSRRNDAQMSAYREPWKKESWMHPIVRSMSGWTRTLLGAP